MHLSSLVLFLLASPTLALLPSSRARLVQPFPGRGRTLRVEVTPAEAPEADAAPETPPENLGWVLK